MRDSIASSKITAKIVVLSELHERLEPDTEKSMERCERMDEVDELEDELDELELESEEDEDDGEVDDEEGGFGSIPSG